MRIIAIQPPPPDRTGTEYQCPRQPQRCRSSRSRWEPTVGQRIDGAVTATKQNADEAQAELKQAATTASNEARQAAADAGDAVADAAITTAVNAKLAADEQLSALRINVDTEGGHVAMVGEAPNESARERATALAQSVRGVQSVDNRLTVKPQS
jgi:hyperosmotically inducible protein